MEQRSPFTSQYNVLRLNPLTKAVAARSGANDVANRPDNLNGRGKNTSATAKNTDPTQVDPAEVAYKQELAAAGDQDAIDWLKTAGVAAAVVGGGVGAYALGRALKNKKAKGITSPNFGAQNVDVQARAPNASTTVAKRAPDVEHLQWEEVSPEEYLKLKNGAPQPRLPSSANEAVGYDPSFYPPGPTQQQMQSDTAYLQKGVQDAKAATRAAQTGTAARKARLFEAAEALKNIRRLGR